MFKKQNKIYLLSSVHVRLPPDADVRVFLLKFTNPPHLYVPPLHITDHR